MSNRRFIQRQSVRKELVQIIFNTFEISQLTILIAMNPTKLMSGFKELFGTTIYGYVADFRMEQRIAAQRQVHESNWSRQICRL